MFKLAPKNAPITWPVIIPEADADGRVTKHKVTFIFNRLSRTELDRRDAAITTAMGDLDAMSVEQTLDVQAERALVYCSGWQDVRGPDNDPLEFNRENLRSLFDVYPAAYPALLQTYLRIMFNGGEAQQKNS
jgi:hypothetical protein